MANPQIENLEAQLLVSGFALEKVQSFIEPGTTRKWTRYRAVHPRGRTVFFFVADLESDGYALMIEQPGIRIADDVAAIFAAAAESQSA